MIPWAPPFLISLLARAAPLFGEGTLTRDRIVPLLERYIFVDNWRDRLTLAARLPCLNPVASVLERYLPGRGPILDLGCGYGLTLHLVHHLRRVPVWGVEVSPRRCAIARRSCAPFPQMEVVCSDLLEVAWPQSAAILLIDVLSMLAPKAQREVMERCTHSLQSGGILVVKDTAPFPRWKFYYTHLEERCKRALKIYGSCIRKGPFYFTPEAFHRQCRSLGFQRLATYCVRSPLPYPGIFYVYRRE